MEAKLPTEAEPALILTGDCVEQMRTLPDGCASCCVTSPPYFGLRDYGTGRWEGGAAECDHRESSETRTEKSKASSTLGGSVETCHASHQFRGVCGKCGAIRVDQQIGLEATPDEYVAKMVAVFREVRRVLRDDGTLWLNLGDSYAGSWGNYSGQNRGKGGQREITVGSQAPNPAYDGLENWRPPASRKLDGIKPKDLIGIPWAVAFALRADGWFLRQDIIWAKPNPMPESVTDRCTKSHEYLFLLSKSERYHFDADAIKEPASGELRPIGKGTAKARNFGSTGGNEGTDVKIGGETRNKRSVWTVATKPYKGAHFATMPPGLVEPCVLAGCPVGGTVLDPFAGSGTTLAVAVGLDRLAIGCELNPDYVALARKRIATALGTGAGSLFADEPA